MSLKDRIAAQQRLLILQSLHQDTDYQLNELMIQIFLGEVGERISVDAIRTHASWLQEQGLATIETVRGMFIITLSNRGIDIVQGSATNPGIARARPE